MFCSSVLFTFLSYRHVWHCLVPPAVHVDLQAYLPATCERVKSSEPFSCFSQSVKVIQTRGNPCEGWQHVTALMTSNFNENKTFTHQLTIHSGLLVYWLCSGWQDHTHTQTHKDYTKRRSSYCSRLSVRDIDGSPVLINTAHMFLCFTPDLHWQKIITTENKSHYRAI